ncbi:MAG: hypothetical protein ACRCUY_07755 [Thermoguttaceae bacterium]
MISRHLLFAASLTAVFTASLTFSVLAPAFALGAEKAQWKNQTEATSASSELKWGQPKTKSSQGATAAKDKSQEIGELREPIRLAGLQPNRIQQANHIQQVQYNQPIPAPRFPAPAVSSGAITPPNLPAPMTPAQQDLIFPEGRPTSNTPPAGSVNITSGINEPSPSSSPIPMPKELLEASKQLENAENESLVPAPGSLQNDSLPNIPAAPLPAERLPEGRGIGALIPSTKDIVCPDTAGFKSIKDISFDIKPMPGTLPKECPLITTQYLGRHFNRTCFQWTASALATKGAYFENAQLERYGHSACPTLQPIFSGARFFLTIPMLPYKMGLNPPNECVYTLGYYRVGNCAPYMLDPFPISVRAILFEAAAVGGAVAVIP